MNLWMGEFIVMSNHFHAIIGIGEIPKPPNQKINLAPNPKIWHQSFMVLKQG